MSELTFLTMGQIFGDDSTQQLEIFQKRGTKCAMTDFAILLGGYVSSDYYASSGNSLTDRTGWWWTKTCDGDNDARAVDYTG